jgi:hypothetical protein
MVKGFGRRPGMAGGALRGRRSKPFTIADANGPEKHLESSHLQNKDF